MAQAERLVGDQAPRKQSAIVENDQYGVVLVEVDWRDASGGVNRKGGGGRARRLASTRVRE